MGNIEPFLITRSYAMTEKLFETALGIAAPWFVAGNADSRSEVDVLLAQLHDP